MSAALLAGINAGLAGILCGASYFVLARGMDLLSLTVRGRQRAPVIVAGFVVRLGAAWGALWGLVQVAHLAPRPLVLGFVGGYTVVLASHSVRQLRRRPGLSSRR